MLQFFILFALPPPGGGATGWSKSWRSRVRVFRVEFVCACDIYDAMAGTVGIRVSRRHLPPNRKSSRAEIGQGERGKKRRVRESQRVPDSLDLRGGAWCEGIRPFGPCTVNSALIGWQRCVQLVFLRIMAVKEGTSRSLEKLAKICWRLVWTCVVSCAWRLDFCDWFGDHLGVRTHARARPLQSHTFVRKQKLA